jgi:hypothetical protein
MAKASNKKGASPTTRKRAEVVTPAAARASKSRTRTATFNVNDVACRAYALYLARGCAHGHDVDDWFQAERELHDATNSDQR